MTIYIPAWAGYVLIYAFGFISATIFWPVFITRWQSRNKKPK